MVLRYALALAAVAVMSVVIGVISGTGRIANISILYLVAVLATATRLGRGPAIFASVAAFLTFDWFFVEPIHQWTIADPEEWIALLFFLIVAIITGQLAANERLRAQQAQRREREAVVLFDALRLLGGPDLDAALHALAERLRAELGARAVAIELVISGQSHSAAAGDAEAVGHARSRHSSAAEVMRSGRAPTPGAAGATGGWIRVVPPKRGPAFEMLGALRRFEVPVWSDGREVGRLALVRGMSEPTFRAQDDRFLAVVATQLGLLAERAELARAATDAEVLRRADDLKTALLGAVSHDLRTPLASIIASAGSLRQPDVTWTAAEREAFLGDIENEARRLARIVGNLLDLSRIEAGQLRPESGWYDLGAIVDDVVGRLRTETREHRVVVDVPDDLPPVQCDYVEIDQVLSNLVGNAARYSPAGSQIDVHVVRAAGEVRIEVADRGPGIPPEFRTRVFERFFRVPSRRGPRGTGLGLAVAKGLVEAHGGRIWAEDRPDGGSLFAFTLPLLEGVVDARPDGPAGHGGPDGTAGPVVPLLTDRR